jgi:lysine-N-methylase
MVDEPHYGALEKAMSGTEADRTRFRDSVRLVKDDKHKPPRYAMMVLDERRSCRLLDPDGGCSVHRRFGQDVLPDTCAIYPRKISLAAVHLEVAGSLSCPEVARQLFASEDSTAVDTLDPRSVRNRVTQFVAPGSDDPYETYLDDVRATIVGLLETPGYPLSSRLFFVGWFAEQTRAAFHRGAGPDAEDVLADAIIIASEEETLASWHRSFASLEVTTPLAGSVIAGALKTRIEGALPYEPFRDLVRACFANLGAHPTGDTLTLDTKATYEAYLEKRAGRDGETVDRLLTSFAIDYWLKDYYTSSQDLAVHANKLLLRIALLRFLLFSHPGFDAADPTPTLVEVTYKLARAVEHETGFAEDLDTLLASLKITSLAHAMFLMKV